MSEVVKIEPSIVERIERLYFDYESYKDVVATCFDLHKADTDSSFLDSEVFKKYQENMHEAFVAYNVAKGELETQYGLKHKSWNLDFTTCELTID